MSTGTIKVTLRRSPIGSKANQRRTLETLGLRKIGKSVEVQDTATIRGKIQVVAHLVETEG